MRNTRRWLLFCWPLMPLLLAAADDAGPPTAHKEALLPYQQLVGTWRGVGQVRRGSNQGAWIEQSDWAWNFAADTGASLCFKIDDSARYFTKGRLLAGTDPGTFELVCTTADPAKDSVRYAGGPDDEGQLVLLAEKPADDLPARISIRLVAGGDRLVILFERRSGEDLYSRLAEVGYTRKGSSFGQGGGGIECIVTGGKGTIPVTHNGQTYYVCCTGCRDLFNDDPEGVLAEYQARREEARKKQSAE